MADGILCYCCILYACAAWAIEVLVLRIFVAQVLHTLVVLWYLSAARFVGFEVVILLKMPLIEI